MRSPDEPRDSDAGAAARPTKRVISWRSRGGRSSRRAPANDVQPVPISTTAAPAAQASWRGGIDPQDRFRSRWLMARRIILTAASLALILLLVRMLLTVRRQVPIVVGFVTSYRFPLAPIALADEDRALIASLGTPGKRFYEPGTAAIFDVSPALASANADELLATLTATLRRVKPGGPDGDMAIVYLTAIGTLDDKGRPCIVPPGTSADPAALEEDSYLSVDRLLAGLRDALPERVGILVVLDACRPSTDWPLGVDDGAFPPAVEAHMAVSNLNRMWVMVPASTGQNSYSSAALGASGAVLEFVRGMRGAADARPWGDADGRVELQELSAYLTLRVDQWARAMLGDRQTPILTSTSSDRNADVALARTASQTPVVELRSDADVSEDAWLADRWRAAEQLRPSAIRERPLTWSAYQHTLLRAEKLRSAGAAYREELVEVDTAVERMETELGLSLISSAQLLPGIRLASSRAELLADRNDDDLPRWLAAAERYIAIGQPRDETAKPPARSDEVDVWMRRAEAAWLWLVKQCEAPANIDRAAVVRWLECVGPRPEGLAFNPVQIHLLRMMVRWADLGDWQRQPEAFCNFIRMVAKSREAVYTYDVRADRIVEATLLASRGNATMREALDLAFVGGPANLAEAIRFSGQSQDAFNQCMTLARQRLQALGLLDVVRAEVPYLAAWWVEELRHAAREPTDAESGGLLTKPSDIVALLLAVEQLELAVDAAVLASGDTATATTPSASAIDEARARCESSFTDIKAVFLASCADLATQAPDSPRTHGAIRRVLMLPLAQGDLRMRLLRRADTLDRRHAALVARSPPQNDDPLPPADATAVVAGWVPWRNALMNPVLPIIVVNPSGSPTLPTSAADIAANVGRQVTAVRSAARSLPSIIAGFDRQRAELEIGSRDSDARALELLARGSTVSRRLAAVAGQRPHIRDGSTPTERYFAAAWHTRLIRHAETTLDEFWAGVEADEPIYCFLKARVLVESAAEIVRSNAIVFGDRERARLTARIDSLAAEWTRFADLEVTPNRLVLPSASGVEPPRNQVSLAARPGVPAGRAAVWLSESVDGRPLALLRSPAGTEPDQNADRAVASRAGVRVVSPPEESFWQLDPTAARSIELNRTAVLDLTAWYRGHRMVVGLPVAAAAASRTTEWEASPQLPTRVTVRGDLPQAQSVAIVFDCSGSMGQRLADGRTRLDAGKAAVAELLAGMATSGRWDVSLWLYGHRTRWSRDKDGKYVAGLTPAGTIAKATAGRGGQPFTLVPGDDVEQVLPMQPLTPALVERMGMTLSPLEPGGETPLYLAISEALITDFDGGRTDRPGHVLVVTDGANDQTGGRSVTVSALEDQLARKNGRRRVPLRVDVIGFGYAANSTDRASRMDEVRNLATGSGGRFYEAANAESLGKSLRESMRLLRWQVRGPDAPRESVGLGASLTLPAALVGRPRAYEAVLESGANPPRRGFKTEGGEAIDLYVRGGRTLEFRRYDGGTEQGLRDSRTDLFAPADPQRLFFVGAHLASRIGNSVRFPLSIQNANAAEFSPRPVESWVEVAPRSGDGAVGGPFVFYDLSFQPNRPVPVLDLVAAHWPRAADRAEIRGWFRFTKTPPDVAVPLADLTPGVERRLELTGLPGSDIRVTLAPADVSDHVQVSVLESHPATLADRLPCVRVCVTPTCLRAVHIVEPETGRVRHEFRVRTEGGRLPPDAQILITDRQRVLSGAVSLTAAGEPPLAVPVPAE